MTTVMYLHGFCSSAKSTKADFLAQHLAGLPDVQVEAFDFNPTPVDFEYMTVTGCIDRLRQYLLERTSEDICFVGSSLGGLVALHYASRYPGVAGMLLLAPAISYPRRFRRRARRLARRSHQAVRTLRLRSRAAAAVRLPRRRHQLFRSPTACMPGGHRSRRRRRGRPHRCEPSLRSGMAARSAADRGGRRSLAVCVPAPHRRHSARDVGLEVAPASRRRAARHAPMAGDPWRDQQGATSAGGPLLFARDNPRIPRQSALPSSVPHAGHAGSMWVRR